MLRRSDQEMSVASRSIWLGATVARTIVRDVTIKGDRWIA